MLSFLLNVFLFLLGLGIGIKYERWLSVKARAGHSRFHETGFADSRYQRSSTFKDSRAGKSGSAKRNSRFHIS